MSRLLSALAALSLSGSAWAQIYAPDGTHPTVQSAVDVAGDDDTIIVTGSVNETLSIVGISNLTIRAESPGFTIDASGDPQTVQIDGGSVIFEGLVLSGGDRIITLVNDASITLRNAEVRDNGGSVFGGGGGLITPTSATNTQVLIEDSLFHSLSVSNNGGQIRARTGSTVIIRNSLFVQGSAGAGGAIYADGASRVDIQNSLFCSNTSGDDGAPVVLKDVATDISNTIFVDNSGGDSGGGLYLENVDAAVFNNHFIGNDAIEGSAVFVQSATSLDLFNNLIAFNTGQQAVMIANSDNVSLEHNLWYQNGTDLSPPGSHGPGAITGQDPLLEDYPQVDNCLHSVHYPGRTSPVHGAGRDGPTNPDGSPGDIGAFGGPEADPQYWVDADSDSYSWISDCDDEQPDVYPGAPETCGDGVDSNCDGAGGPEEDEDGDGLSFNQEHLFGADDCTLDSDGDAIEDAIEWGPDPANPPDSDGDGLIDAVDDDDDGDQILTVIEGTGDADCDENGNPEGDGIPNYLDDDSDGDGVSDEAEGAGDYDEDGIPDFLDCDDGKPEGENGPKGMLIGGGSCSTLSATPAASALWVIAWVAAKRRRQYA